MHRMSTTKIIVVAGLMGTLIIGAVFFFKADPVLGQALSILRTSQGGTGWGNITTDTLLTGNGTGKLATTSIGTGLTLSGGVLSASAALFPFTTTAYGVSTSTTVGFTNGILVNAASSTIEIGRAS